ncbi:MAG: hypothetical protein ABIJ61_05735 [bacterium]
MATRRNELKLLSDRVAASPHSLTESDFAAVLSNYSLLDALTVMGRVSIVIYRELSQDVLNGIALVEPVGGGIIAQHQLAFLANMAVLSEAIDSSPEMTSQEGLATLFILCSLHANGLPDPLLEDSGKLTRDELELGFLIRGIAEQFDFQARDGHEAARATEVFTSAMQEVGPSRRLGDLQRVFLTETGLSIESYLKTGMLIMSVVWFTRSPVISTSSVAYRLSEFIESGKLSHEEIDHFIRMKSASYGELRELDAQLNSGLKDINIKTRLNPLALKPIIQVQSPSKSMTHVIPNCSLYARSVFSGLYWWFHHHFEKIGGGSHLAFREYFGRVFETYMGRVLRNTFGDENVMSGRDTEGPIEFYDWLVEEKGRVYLIETKAYQLSLRTRQTGNADLFKSEVEKKVVAAIVQTYRRRQDLQKHPTLSCIERTTLHTVIVFYDFPLVTRLPNVPWFRELLARTEREHQLPGLASFQFHLAAAEDLELCSSVLNDSDLATVLSDYRLSGKMSMTEFVRSKTGVVPRNDYLTERFVGLFY